MNPSLHQTQEVAVLVVGAGPAGLAAAIELARRDVDVLLVERRTVLSSHPRATALSLRSTELMRAWGLEDAVRDRGVEVHPTMLETETLAGAAAGTPIAVGYPTREQSRVLSPTEPVCIAQDDLEPLLLEHARSGLGARVELGTELTGLDIDAAGPRATLRDVHTGVLRTVRARHVVAGDGAHSVVRAAVGIALEGTEDVMTGGTTLLRAPLWDVVGPHRHLLYSVTDPGSPAVLLPAGPDRWLFASGLEGWDPFDPARTEALVRLAAGVPGLPVRIERSGRFSSAAQVADRFRSGPVFLAGDAAHRVTPRGGTGLNLALHDGADLGWKLAWVARGWAAPALLDTYEAERRPVAEHTAARSADPMGSRRAAEREVPADLGGRIPHVWAGGRSTLDLLGPGLTLLAGRDGAAWEAAAASLRAPVPVRVQVLDGIVARAVGAPGASALLVRPDGRPAAVLPAGAEPAWALRAAISAALQPARSATGMAPASRAAFSPAPSTSASGR